jgi:hypothetical protein
MYTGIHTVHPATLPSVSETVNSPYLPICLGAVFADMQSFPHAGARHASECKLRTPVSSFSLYYDTHALTIS